MSGTHYICGNGPSLTKEVLTSLPRPVWTVNRIWKMFVDPAAHPGPAFRLSDWSEWKPDYYVRGEVPSYNAEHVQQDLEEMANSGCLMFLEEGFKGYATSGKILAPLDRSGGGFTFFRTCGNNEPHDWHLPEICGYGSIIHVAMKLAINRGAEKIVLVGCDMGTPNHFYGEEGVPQDETLEKAHKIASRCSPVPIADGNTRRHVLRMYPRAITLQ